MLPDQPPRPSLVVQPIHLLAGVAQGSVAHIVQQGRGVEHGSMFRQFKVVALQLLQSQAG